MFSEIEKIKNYYVYEYQYIDDLSAIVNPFNAYRWYESPESDEYKQKIQTAIEEVKKLFALNGWEGDGAIGLIWVPPFIDVGTPQDGFGSYLWHVKQSNNGTSFIASEHPLSFPNLTLRDDQFELDEEQDREEVNILQEDIDNFLHRLKGEYADFQGEVTKLENHHDAVSIAILEKYLGYTQCALVSQFNDLLDDCYLTILLEVLQNGNRGKLRLRKSSVNVDLAEHTHFEDGIDDIESSSWMTMQMVISDIWKAYKFESFGQKFDRLIKSLEYKLDEQTKAFIFKHVFIRNCIQHHGWQLHGSVRSVLGRTSIEIATDKTPIRIEQWKTIILTQKEILLLFSEMKEFAVALNKHVDKRVETRVNRPKQRHGI